MKWEIKELGELIDLYDNIRIPLSAIEREKRQGEYPYYGAQSIIDYVNEYLFDGDYILIAEDGENLRTRTQPIAFAVKGQFWVNNHAHIIKGKGNIADDLFIKYFLNNLDINPYVTGAAQPKLSQKNLRAIVIETPPLPTQRKIAAILSAYDDLIENNLKRVRLLEEGAFLRYKGIVRREKLLKKLPLVQIATVTSSKRIFLSDYVEEGIPFYRSKEIIAKSNFESIEKPLYITQERYGDIKEKFGVPVSGDLLITSVGTIGFVHLVNDDDGDFYFKDGNLIWIKNLLQQKLAYFLFFKFRTPEFKEMLNSVAIGSSQKALTIETVKKIEIGIPNDDSLIEFNQETKTIIKFIYNLQKQNTKLREAREILLPRLMSGEIEV